MASLYDLLNADEPSAAEQAAALQKALRRQQAAGVLGALTGDKVLGQVGQGLMAGAARGEAGLVDVGQFRQRQAAQRQNQQAEEAYRQGMLGVAQQNANSQEQARRDMAAYRREMLKAQQPQPAPVGPVGPPAPGANPKGAEDLRKEFQKLPVYGATQSVAEAYRKIRDTSDNGEGDLSLIYSFVKMLDPGSVVREGEIKLSREPTPLVTELVQRYSRAAKGDLLHPTMRAKYKEEARKLLEAQHDRFEDTAQPYRRLALQQGVNPHDAVMDDGVFNLLADAPRGGGVAPRAAGGIAQIASDADYDALPPGTEFVGPDGKRRRKP